MSHALFWVISWRLNFICRRFGTHYLFHLHSQVDQFDQIHSTELFRYDRSAVINKATSVKWEKWDLSRISYIAESFDRNMSKEKIVPNDENLLNTEAQDAEVNVSTLETIMIWISLKGLVAWVNADFPTFQATLQLTSSGCMKSPYTGLGAVQPRQSTKIIIHKRLRFRITKQKVKRQDFGSGNYNNLFKKGA